jgi:hypothetical protein
MDTHSLTPLTVPTSDCSPSTLQQNADVTPLLTNEHDFTWVQRGPLLCLKIKGKFTGADCPIADMVADGECAGYWRRQLADKTKEFHLDVDTLHATLDQAVARLKSGEPRQEDCIVAPIAMNKAGDEVPLSRNPEPIFSFENISQELADNINDTAFYIKGNFDDRLCLHPGDRVTLAHLAVILACDLLKSLPSFENNADYKTALRFADAAEEMLDGLENRPLALATGRSLLTKSTQEMASAAAASRLLPLMCQIQMAMTDVLSEAENAVTSCVLTAHDYEALRSVWADSVEYVTSALDELQSFVHDEPCASTGQLVK